MCAGLGVPAAAFGQGEFVGPPYPIPAAWARSGASAKGAAASAAQAPSMTSEDEAMLKDLDLLFHFNLLQDIDLFEEDAP